MQCTQGHPVPAGNNFCGSCGSPVVQPVVVQKQPSLGRLALEGAVIGAAAGAASEAVHHAMGHHAHHAVQHATQAATDAGGGALEGLSGLTDFLG